MIMKYTHYLWYVPNRDTVEVDYLDDIALPTFNEIYVDGTDDTYLVDWFI